MAIMIANGASAGSLSPIAPTGVIVDGLVARMGLVGVEWRIYFNNLLVHTAVAVAGYFLFGGLRLLRAGPRPFRWAQRPVRADCPTGCSRGRRSTRRRLR